MFLSTFVKSFILGFIENGFLFATHSVAFSAIVLFVEGSDFSLISPTDCVKKNCSSSAISEEGVVTSMGVVCTSSRTLRRIFSVTTNSKWERKSAAVSTEPAICAVLELNCSKNCMPSTKMEEWLSSEKTGD